MKSAVLKAIVKAVLYSDIFNYPLTRDELWKYLIVDDEKKISRKEFEEEIDQIASIEEAEGMYFCSHKTRLVGIRKKREKVSQGKFRIAQSVSRYLRFIPTIQFIGVSGGLAMSNADSKDDIDLFIICEKGTVWTTRLLTLVVLEVLGRRRKRNEKNVRDKICANMIIDEKSLDCSVLGRDLFVAHEIVQMKPLLNRNNMFEKFLTMNKWVLGMLPNGMDTEMLRYQNTKKKKKKSLTIFERFAKWLQLKSITRHQTTEVITDGILAFHPKDYRWSILKEYDKRVKRYEI